MTPRTRSQNAALQAREVKRAPLTDTSFTTHQHANDHTKHKKFTQSTKQWIDSRHRLSSHLAMFTCEKVSCIE